MLTELRNKKDTYVATSKKILEGAEGRALTVAETKDFDGLLSKIKDINSTLERSAILNEMRDGIDKPAAPVRQHGAEAPLYFGETRAYRRNEPLADTAYQGPGFGALVRGSLLGNWRGAEDLRDMVQSEQRAMGEGSLNLGGAAVPTPLSSMFIDIVRPKAQCIAAGVLVIPMESATLKLARLLTDSTSNFRAENAAIVYSDAGLDQVTLTGHSVAAAIKVSRELLEDSVNADRIIMNSLSQSMALAIDAAILYGSGSANQPLGVKNQTGVQTLSMGVNGATPVDFKKVSAAVGNLLSANFQPTLGAIYSPRTSATFDALTDTLGQPLRMPPNVDKLEKYVTGQAPVNLTVGTSADCSDIFVGKWDQVVLGTRVPMILEVSREAGDGTSSAFTSHQIWIKAVARLDVAMLHGNAVTVITGVRG